MWQPSWVFAYEYNPEPLGFNIITKKPNVKAQQKKKKKPNLIKTKPAKQSRQETRRFNGWDGMKSYTIQFF